VLFKRRRCEMEVGRSLNFFTKQKGKCSDCNKVDMSLG
jgi:hypothetical protein